MFDFKIKKSLSSQKKSGESTFNEDRFVYRVYLKLNNGGPKKQAKNQLLKRAIAKEIAE